MSAPGVDRFPGVDLGPGDRAPDIVFLHANGFCGAAYRAMLRPLTDEGLRILAPDLRGHGANAAPAPEIGRHASWRLYRDDVIAFIENHVGGPALLAGHSMGATTALLVSAKRRDLVSGLVLCEPVLGPWSFHAMAAISTVRRSLQKRFPLSQGALKRRRSFASRQEAFDSYKGRGAFKTWDEEALRGYVECGFRDAGDGRVELACAPEWEAANFVAQGHDPWTAARRSKAPARVLLGAKGSTCPASSAWRLDHLANVVSMERVPGTTHFLPMERGDLVRAALGQAIKATSSAAAPA